MSFGIVNRMGKPGTADVDSKLTSDSSPTYDYYSFETVNILAGIIIISNTPTITGAIRIAGVSQAEFLVRASGQWAHRMAPAVVRTYRYRARNSLTGQVGIDQSFNVNPSSCYTEQFSGSFKLLLPGGVNTSLQAGQINTVFNSCGGNAGYGTNRYNRLTGILQVPKGAELILEPLGVTYAVNEATKL